MISRSYCLLVVATWLLAATGRLGAQPPAAPSHGASALPFVESDPNRRPLRVGSLAPDFTLPLAPGCHWQLPAAEHPQATGAGRLPSPTPGPPAATLHFADFRALPGAAPAAETAAGAAAPPVTILVFWAFWCDTWKDAVRDFKALRARLEGAGARILVVAVDASQQPVGRAALASGDIWYPVVIDARGETTTHYGVRRVPTLFVIAADGHIHACYEAFPGERKLLQAVRSAARP